MGSRRTRYFLFLVVLLVVGFGVLGTVLFDLSFRGSPSVGTVDLKQIVETVPFFREERKLWTRNRRTLAENYDAQLKELRDVFEEYSIDLGRLRKNSSREFSRPRSRSSTSFDTFPPKITEKLPQATRKKIKTLVTRKRRAQYVIRRKQENLRSRGLQKIKRAVRKVAESRGIDVVYHRETILYKNETITDSPPSPKSSPRDLTSPVISRLGHHSTSPGFP